MNHRIKGIDNKKVIMKCLIISILFISLLFLFSIPLSHALKNPSAVYCEALGFTNVIQITNQGETGYCRISDDLSVDAWQFLEGKVAQDFSYCRKMGYDIETVSNFTICDKLATSECAVCILSNGTEVEVTKLMDLDFRESPCGDGNCAIGENYENCPQDCSSGSIDMLCDGVNDGICDPDCTRMNIQNQDPDCLQTTTTLPTAPSIPVYIYVVIIGIIVVVVLLLVYKIKAVR